jgi:virulence-associated protein VagC
MGIGKPFESGRQKTGGRARGTRNHISESFLRDLMAEWEASGARCLKILTVEDPAAFVKVVASILPKEFTFSAVETELDDEDLSRIIEQLRQRVLAERQQAEPILIESKADVDSTRH